MVPSNDAIIAANAASGFFFYHVSNKAITSVGCSTNSTWNSSNEEVIDWGEEGGYLNKRCYNTCLDLSVY